MCWSRPPRESRPSEPKLIRSTSLDFAKTTQITTLRRHPDERIGVPNTPLREMAEAVSGDGRVRHPVEGECKSFAAQPLVSSPMSKKWLRVKLVTARSAAHQPGAKAPSTALRHPQ